MTWSTAAPAISAAFLASLVEVVEAFTIVLAVATLRGWRPAAVGTTAGLAVLAGIVLLLTPLLERIPITALQLTIGILLLLFGMGWLRKASLRAAGVIPLHDEDAIFAAEPAQRTIEPAILRDMARRRAGLEHRLGIEMRAIAIWRRHGVEQKKLPGIIKRLQLGQSGMKSEMSIKIDQSLGRRHRQGAAQFGIAPLAIRRHRGQAIERAAHHDNDEAPIRVG